MFYFKFLLQPIPTSSKIQKAIGKTTSSMFLPLESSNNSDIFKKSKKQTAKRRDVFNVFTLASGILKQFRLLQKSKKRTAKRRLQCFHSCLWNPLDGSPM